MAHDPSDTASSFLMLGADDLTGMARALATVARYSGHRLGHTGWLGAIAHALGFRNANSLSAALSEAPLLVGVGDLGERSDYIDVMKFGSWWVAGTDPSLLQERALQGAAALDAIRAALRNPEVGPLNPVRLPLSDTGPTVTVVGAPIDMVAGRLGSFAAAQGGEPVSPLEARLWWRAAARSTNAAPLPPGDRDDEAARMRRLGFHLHRHGATAADRVPAVPVEISVMHDSIVCLDDGLEMKQLKRHLRTAHGLTPEQYRARWGLAEDYPLVAPGYLEGKRLFAAGFLDRLGPDFPKGADRG